MESEIKQYQYIITQLIKQNAELIALLEMLNNLKVVSVLEEETKGRWDGVEEASIEEVKQGLGDIDGLLNFFEGYSQKR